MTTKRNDFSMVKRASDLEQYIKSQAGGDTDTKRQGNTIRFNPCPLCGHNDCFTLYPDEQTYKCYSCQAAGDVFTFHIELNNGNKDDKKDQAAALKAVADFFGVEIATKPPKAEQDRREISTSGGSKSKEDEEFTRRQQIFEATVAHYRQVLEKRADLKAILTEPKSRSGRGHTQKTIDYMEIGLSDGKLAQTLKKQGFSLDEITNAGLYTEREYKGEKKWFDYFVPNLFIYPHRTETGEIGHFTLKDPNKKIEYQFRSDYRHQHLLFGNQKAINNDTVIICEGENDLASFIDAGHRNVLATIGQLTRGQMNFLTTNSSGKKFVLFFDNDDKYGDNFQPPAGIAYTRKLYHQLLRQPGCEVRVASVAMNPGEDPDDWIQKDLESAPKRLKQVVFKAQDPMAWEIKVLPDHVKGEQGAIMEFLKDIEFFNSMSYLREYERKQIALLLEEYGFSQAFILESIEEDYGLKESISDVVSNNESRTLTEFTMQQVSHRAWSWFKERGKYFVIEDKPFLFYKSVIYQVGSNLPWRSMLNYEAGLNATQPLTKYVNEQLQSQCFQFGERMNALSWVHYVVKKKKPILYINMNDPANRIMRLSEGKAELVDNGTNKEQVLLAQSHQMQEFNFDPLVDVDEAMAELKRLVYDSMSCSPVQRFLVLSWTLSAFFLPLVSSRALMKMEGGTASGKTTAAKYCSLLVYGTSMVSDMSAAAAYSMGATEPLLIMDNLETEDISKPMRKFLLLVSTGASKIKRKAGTDTDVAKEVVNCLVAITAIEPLALPEMINRTYLVQFHKKFRNDGFRDTALSEELKKKRDQILSAWMLVLAKEVLPKIGEYDRLQDYMKTYQPDSSKERVNEHLAYMSLIGRALAKYIPLPEDFNQTKRVDSLLIDHWTEIQNMNAQLNESGTNQILQFLDSIRNDFVFAFRAKGETQENIISDTEDYYHEKIGLVIQRVKKGDSFEFRFEVTTKSLLDAFQRHARERGIKVPWSSARQLGARISNEMPVLIQAGWRKERSRKNHGERYDWYVWSPDLDEG